MLFITCTLFGGLLGLKLTQASEGNIATTNKYAWAENAGWLNFRPTDGGVTVHTTYLSGYAWAENIGWIKLGSGTGPYTNTTSGNWGVNRDSSTGALSGYAWSENAGWINFDPPHSQVTIDATTGSFGGYAWAENVGWIHFKYDDPSYNVALSSITPDTYYVDIKDGNNANDGLSADNAWKTLHYAIERINSGSSGEFESGPKPQAGTTDYELKIIHPDTGEHYSYGNGEPDTPLVITQDNVTIIGEEGSAPIIDGTNAVNWTYGIKIDASNVTLRNLYVTGFTGTDPSGTGIEIVSGSNNTIRECKVYENHDGISVWESDYCTIRGCEVHDNANDGISFSKSNNGLITENSIHDHHDQANSDGIIVQDCGSETEISRNKIYDSHFNVSLQAYDGEVTSPTVKNNLIFEETSGEVDYGIMIGGVETSTVSPKIYHNTIDQGTYDGIVVEKYGTTSTVSPEIKYNIITNFGQYGISNSSGTPSVDYNDVWGNASGTYDGCSGGAHGVSLNPLFTGATPSNPARPASMPFLTPMIP
ncbi:MAG: right-handed parallel beta-helix repeat-containing protein [Deltaproteobacteria bacterium]|nr:right-handed parallel beta-helix repeat-containing protein [Deltaproteobacteria bacterium]